MSQEDNTLSSDQEMEMKKKRVSWTKNYLFETWNDWSWSTTRIGHCLSQEDNTLSSGVKNAKNEFHGQRIIFLRHEMIGLGQLLRIGHCLSQEGNTLSKKCKKWVWWTKNYLFETWNDGPWSKRSTNTKATNLLAHYQWLGYSEFSS